MVTASVITLHLAIVIGLYEIAAGLAGLSGRIRWTDLIDEFERSPALTFMTGVVVYAIGAAMVLVHALWTDALAAIVTLIGLAAAAEGLLLLIAPGALMALARPLARYQRVTSLIALLFGALMLIAGLAGRADPTIIL